MKFTYRCGQRPLEGYTIKRGVGQGGFGEVYFAVSDSGKEVALKLLRGHRDIELRGIASCLNLKHPNLIHIYDLRTDVLGDTWLIMEYVLGESMAQVISRHPHGLPLNLVREWFVNLSRAVGFLHDHGVVHRDLKPANIFIENGTLKVGDYGLCKALGNSHREQTRNIGTVHYMAPEISTGNYNKQIDVYSCGVILHEMLTGVVPFDGESDGEILMKHLTAVPDLSRVPEPFRPVIARALDKNPVRRFTTMTEFARAVESAAEAQAGTPAGSPVSEPPPVAKPLQEPPPPQGMKSVIVARPVSPSGSGSAAPPPGQYTAPAAPAVTSGGSLRDRLTSLAESLAWAPFFVLLGIIPYAVVTHTSDVSRLGELFLETVAFAWAILLGSSGASYRIADSWGRRLRLGGLGLLVGLFVYWLDGWPMPRLIWPTSSSHEQYLFSMLDMPAESISVALHYLVYFGGVLLVGRWWRVAARDRKDRFGLFPLFAAGFWSSLLIFLWPWESGSPVAGAIVPLVIAVAAVQLASSWVEPPPPPPKRLRWRG
jgi:serine/threonine protein kinase